MLPTRLQNFVLLMFSLEKERVFSSKSDKKFQFWKKNNVVVYLLLLQCVSHMYRKQFSSNVTQSFISSTFLKLHFKMPKTLSIKCEKYRFFNAYLLTNSSKDPFYSKDFFSQMFVDCSFMCKPTKMLSHKLLLYSHRMIEKL